MAAAIARCPIRPGDACTLCYQGATGPQDCGLVWLVMSDPELRDRLRELKAAIAEAAEARERASDSA